MKIQWLCIFFIFYTQHTLARPSQLEATCDYYHGTMIPQWQCPQSGKIRKEKFCVIKDSQENPIHFNGCTFSYKNYGETFFKACVNHDFCYHHEPTTHGFSKDHCDRQFLQDMMTLCDHNDPHNKLCHANAKSFYYAVKYFGTSSWKCSKEPANYFEFSNWPR